MDRGIRAHDRQAVVAGVRLDRFDPARPELVGEPAHGATAGGGRLDELVVHHEDPPRHGGGRSGVIMTCPLGGGGQYE